MGNHKNHNKDSRPWELNPGLLNCEAGVLPLHLTQARFYKNIIILIIFSNNIIIIFSNNIIIIFSNNIIIIFGQ